MLRADLCACYTHLFSEQTQRTQRNTEKSFNGHSGCGTIFISLPREDHLLAITSPSGQVGFLQQFTSNKDALRSAVARLNYRNSVKTDMDQPPMSQYLAMKIREGDEQAMIYYIQEVQKQHCYMGICSVTPDGARQMVRTRAQQIVAESAPSTDDTLRLLEGLMRTAAQIPGRKLVFVISDGFYLSDSKTTSIDRLKRVARL